MCQLKKDLFKGLVKILKLFPNSCVFLFRRRYYEKKYIFIVHYTSCRNSDYPARFTCFSIRFIEIMFFSGVAFTALTVWFSGSGGMVTRFIDSRASAMTGFLSTREEFSFRPNYAVLGSVIFLLIGLLFFILLLTNVIPPI